MGEVRSVKLDVGRKRRRWSYPAKQSQSPDCGLRIGDSPATAGANRAKQTQLVGANYAKQTQSADPGPGGHRLGDLTGGACSRADCAKQTQFAWPDSIPFTLWSQPRTGWVAPTKGCPRRLIPWHRRPADAAWARRPCHVGPFQRLRLLPRMEPGHLLSSETKDKCFGGKGLWLIAPARGLGNTKPIPGGWGGTWGPAGRSCETKPIWRWPAGIRGQIVQNKANCPRPGSRGSQSCETNPIGRNELCKTNPICRSGPRWARAGGLHWRGLLSR
jgi:hypothetical protein